MVAWGWFWGTGGDDCVDLCASLFRFCGRYGARAQKSRATNDRSGGSRVLVIGIVLIPTVGEAIVQEGTASMHVDGIDARVLDPSSFSRRKLVGTKIIKRNFKLKSGLEPLLIEDSYILNIIQSEYDFNI